jgi:hypothetical protein
MPTLEAFYAWEDVKPDAIPAGYPGELPERPARYPGELPDKLAEHPGELPSKLTQQGYVGLSFGYDTWSWSVGHTIIDFNDRTSLGRSSRTNRTEVRAYVPLRDCVTLSPSVQAEWVKYHRVSDSTNILVGMRVDGTAIPDRLEGSVAASYVRFFTNNRLFDEHTVDVTGQIDWTAVKAKNNLPGLTFSILGSYQGVEDDAVRGAVRGADGGAVRGADWGADRDLFQVFLRATLDWPVAFGGR